MNTNKLVAFGIAGFILSSGFLACLIYCVVCSIRWFDGSALTPVSDVWCIYEDFNYRTSDGIVYEAHVLRDNGEIGFVYNGAEFVVDSQLSNSLQKSGLSLNLVKSARGQREFVTSDDFCVRFSSFNGKFENLLLERGVEM